MNRGIYATGTGMLVAQKLLDITANNIANVNTGGYKADSVAFNDVFQRELGFSKGNFDGIGTLGSGPAFQGQFTDKSLGSMKTTSNPLDVAIAREDGMFAVQTPEGTRYTRDGAFSLDNNGTLVNQSGYPVLDNKGATITIPSGSQGPIAIGNGGQISVDGKPVAQLGVYDGSFTKEGANLWSATNPTVEDNPEVRQFVLEGSNVNPMMAMIDMIKVSRAVELAQKSIQSQDDSSQKLLGTLG
jgi:flagellar basal-body rod protein FlgG